MEGSRSNLVTRRRWAWAVRGAAGLAAATGVSVAAAADGPRAAVLLPPRIGEPAPAGVVARGAASDDPLATTPVARRTPPSTRPLVQPTGAKAAPAPDWLSGVDPNVIPAGANVPAKTSSPLRLTNDPRAAAVATPSPGSAKLAAPPPLFGPGESHPLAKGVEALKGGTTPAATPTGSPADPVQGTTANGAPVLAGPPAWRWYGYGTVTPGANPYAPSGQYPRGSANWYSVTKATPGAFPVPVVNPFRGGPGAEPPSYAGAAPQPNRPAVAPPQPIESTTIMPQPRPTPAPAPRPTTPTGGTKFGPPPAEPTTVLPPPVIPIPTLSPGPVPAAVAVAPPVLAPIPLPPPPSLAPLSIPKGPEPVAAAGKDEPESPTAAKAPSLPPLPPLSVMPANATPPPPLSLPAIPTVAPVSAPAAGPLDTEIRWQSNPEHQPAPAPGTWTKPAERRPMLPGASLTPRLPIARAQAGDEVQQLGGDPVEAVVQAICRGRATGIDVRHTGPRKVTVCFETRTSTDATALVRDLSARPELAPYEINFCVLVK